MSNSRTMSPRPLALALSVAVLSLAACDAGDPTSVLDAPIALSAGMAKSDVCHRSSQGDFKKISIADAAYDTHIAHGDGGIGDPVPGMAGYTFDDACQPAELATIACSWDNGGFVTHPGAGAGGADVSMASPGSYNAGGSNAIYLGQHFRLADDFAVGVACTLSEIVVFAYESDRATPTWTRAEMNLRAGSVTGDIVAAATSTSWEWSGVYRVFNGLFNLGSTARPVQRISFEFGDLELEPGTYWVDWRIVGGSSAWGNYVMRPDPVAGGANTITVFDNGRQLTTEGWEPILASPGAEIPFLVRGPGAGALASHASPESGFFMQSLSVSADAREDLPQQ
jgi:hypothetical protein